MLDQGGDVRKRLLFVDDEPAILGSLESVMRRERGQWDMVFALGGERALAELRAAPFDVVISDMRMPGLDGAALLGIVQAEFPATVRILLSGHAERESIVRALPATHQFLSKPCNRATLRGAIERCLAVVARPGDAEIRALIGRLDKLPSPPAQYFELARLASSPTSTLADVAAVVARDPAMAAKVLQLANSAAFGLSRTVSSIRDAVTYLGIDLLKCIALTTSLFASGHAAMERMQARSVEVAGMAKELVADRALAETAFVAGLLHDIGNVVLATSELAGDARFVESQAEIGACLLGVWGLPYAIVDAVANHRVPSRAPADLAPIVGAVHVARALVANEPDAIDHAFLIEHRLDGWLAESAA
jgi:HD-like signal output (HDOD) protein/ActR/RegA family two-component response regulator